MLVCLFVLFFFGGAVGVVNYIELVCLCTGTLGEILIDFLLSPWVLL